MAAKPDETQSEWAAFEPLEILQLQPQIMGDLQRLLSLKSLLSSPLALCLDSEKDTWPPFATIGQGYCAVIHDWPTHGRRIIKRAHGLPGKNDALWNDYKCHIDVHRAMSSVDKPWGVRSLSVPIPHYFVTAANLGEWIDGERLAANPFKEPTSVLIAEKISPLPRPIRESLIRLFCAPSDIEAALSDEKNKDCLLRIYLGVRRPVTAAAAADFSLRNFELTLDKMTKLGLDPKQFIPSMAGALAVMHHHCLQDADDVEFVLGSASEPPLSCTGSAGNATLLRRSVCMWLLDFNNVGKIQLNPDGAKQCMEAFWRNDPYYPRPGTADKELWELFKDVYMEKAGAMGYDTRFGVEFLQLVEEEAKRRGNVAAGMPPKGGPPGGPRPGKRSGQGKEKKARRYVQM
jgi:hypothetical protein